MILFTEGIEGNKNTLVKVATPLILCIKFSATLSATTMLCARPAYQFVKFSRNFQKLIKFLHILIYHKLFQNPGLYVKSLHPFATTQPVSKCKPLMIGHEEQKHSKHTKSSPLYLQRRIHFMKYHLCK